MDPWEVKSDAPPTENPWEIKPESPQNPWDIKSTAAPAPTPWKSKERGRTLKALGETALSLASGATTGFAGSVVDMGKFALDVAEGRPPSEAIMDFGKTRDAWTYTPKTETGQRMTQAIGYLPQKAAEYSGDVGAFVGEKLGNEAAGRSIGEQVPNLVSQVFGARQLMKGVGPAAIKPLTQKQVAIQSAQKEGLYVDPALANPTTMNKFMRFWGDPVRVQEAIGKKNTPVINGLAKAEVGVPLDQHLNEATISALKADAGRAYDQVRQIPGDILPDAQFTADVDALTKRFENIKDFTPQLYDMQGVERVKGSLAQPQSQSHPGAYTADAIVDITKRLREKSNRILGKVEISDSEYQEAAALRSGASALEDLLDRDMKRRFPPNVPAVQSGRFAVDKWRAAREQYAKVSDIEAVTNLQTGDVDPTKLANMAKNGAPLSGNLKKIADAALGMEEVVHRPTYKASRGPFSASDVTQAEIVGGASHMSPDSLGVLMMRPLSRAVVSSDWWQKNKAQVPTPQPTRSFRLGEAAKSLPIYESTNIRPEDENTGR